MQKNLSKLYRNISKKKTGAISALFFVALAAGFAIFLCLHVTSAQTVDEIKSKIDDRTESIRSLEAEIKKFQTEIDAIGKDADTLKNTLAELDISKKKLDAEINLTQRKIDNVNDDIKQLQKDIGDKEDHISDSRTVIASSINAINEIGTASVLETFLSNNSIGDAWRTIDELNFIQGNLKGHISDLKQVKVDLETNKKETEAKRAELLALTNKLKSQRDIVASTAKDKNDLLAQTKNMESNYKALVADREAKKLAFENEIIEYESALKIAVDSNALPSAGSGILKWPLDSVFITQYFGNTPFATANSQIYNGRGHTGIDLRASIGTPVKAALTGTVIGTGNTDIVRGCYSYGKWVMVKHPNGLSTLYAHLSLIGVAKGDTVTTGSLLGYSGSTGYVTGPHLHFGVYATEGVRITTLTASKNCTGVTIPIADFKAYLNPLSYL